MPPALSESEVSSEEREIAPRKAKGKKPVTKEVEDVAEAEAGVPSLASDEGEDDEEEEVYVVEKILAHDLDWDDKEPRYQIKWLGYDSKADLTWEVKENLEGARELLQEYWNKIGGEPGIKATKKRGRKSITKPEADAPDTSDTPDQVTKKQKTSAPAPRGRPGRKKKQEIEVEEDEDPVIADNWVPPPVTPGAWENDVMSIETIEGIGDEKFAYLIWAAKDEKGGWHTSKAKLSTVYIACPQRMLKFYESHLVFTDKARDAEEKETNGE